MGMYTAFRCKALIKPEYHALVQAIVDAYLSPLPKGSFGSEPTGHWLGLDKLAETYPFLKELAGCEHGGTWLSWFVDDEWKDEWYRGDVEWQLSFQNGVWVFQSCMKNYDQEYQRVATILDIIAERIDYCARWYEEDFGPQKYVNGAWEQPPREPGPHDSWLWHDEEG
jgi:hypothetical protein